MGRWLFFAEFAYEVWNGKQTEGGEHNGGKRVGEYNGDHDGGEGEQGQQDAMEDGEVDGLDAVQDEQAQSGKRCRFMLECKGAAVRGRRRWGWGRGRG